MEFKDALQQTLSEDAKVCSDSFLIYSRVSDLIGDDYNAKKAAEDFYRLDSQYDISKTILEFARHQQEQSKKGKPSRCKRKKNSHPPLVAYVYRTYNSPVLHLSSECPCMDTSYYLRDTYKWAAFRKCRADKKDPKKFATDLALVKATPMQMCNVCGEFSPKIPNAFVRWKTDFLYKRFGIEPSEKLISRKYYYLLKFGSDFWRNC